MRAITTIMKKKIKVLNSEDGYNVVADLYDENENYLNSFEQGELVPLLGAIANKKILDVGAGTGRLTTMLANREAIVTALDASEKMLKILRSKCSDRSRPVTMVVGDAENLPFDNDTFDTVTAAFLIVHLKDPARFFDEAYRVLKDGGLFVVTNINQKDPPPVKTKEGQVIIESFYHRPEKIREILESLAFGIKEEVFIYEGRDASPVPSAQGGLVPGWINQIIVVKK